MSGFKTKRTNLRGFTVPKGLSHSQINLINRLLSKVSERQIRDFGKISADYKSDGSLITSCDQWSDKTLVDGLAEIAPGEGVLSEEGSKIVPDTEAYWIVDPLDGTTNFTAGIPFWAISVARFLDGRPESAFLYFPALQQRIFAVKGKGVLLNDIPLSIKSRMNSKSACTSLCSRSIRVLQQRPNKPFPGKIRLLGVASLNLASVALGQTIAALEATPKIWDIASSWLVLSELECPIKWLDNDPCHLKPGEEVGSTSFPMLAASTHEELEKMLPWGETLLDK